MPMVSRSTSIHGGQLCVLPMPLGCGATRPLAWPLTASIRIILPWNNRELNGGHCTRKDLRCTFITEMLKDHSLEDVRQAAGHATSRITHKHYIKDARGLGLVKFRPKK